MKYDKKINKLTKACGGLVSTSYSDVAMPNLHVKDASECCLRSNSGLLLRQPSARLRKKLGDRSLTSAAPTLCNKLPAHLQEIDNLINFKSSLKAHLFRIAFYNCF